MILKVVLFPVWLIKFALGSVFGIVKFVLGFGFGILSFIFSHTIGAVIGLAAGLLLGNRHVDIKLFPGKKKVKKD
ncbi:MAG: hypothetical protein GF398_09635 [Chitinivibrionales bacterium]|nr:hypothetical protein [Chitinivibrionales bacterium]